MVDHKIKPWTKTSVNSDIRYDIINSIHKKVKQFCLGNLKNDGTVDTVLNNVISNEMVTTMTATRIPGPLPLPLLFPAPPPLPLLTSSQIKFY